MHLLRRHRERITEGALAIAVACAQLRIVVLLYGSQYRWSVDAARGVLSGHPHWRIYQNRVLAPWLVSVLARVFPSFLSAHAFFCVFTLTIAGVLAWRLGDRVAGRHGSALAFVALHASFTLLLSKPWLYAWDLVDLIAFIAFIDFVIAERPWPWFVALFGVAILNHEIAAFIAVWLVADPIARVRFAPRSKPADWRPVVAGAACLAGGAVLVEALRDALLVEEMGPKIFRDAPTDIGRSVNFTLFKNLAIVGHSLTDWRDYAMPIIVPVFLATATWSAVSTGRRAPARLAGLAFTYVCLIAALFAFGELLETRIYVVLIPLVVLAALHAVADQRS